MVTEEPSYLAFARANVKDNIPSSSLIVRSLIERIDTDQRTIRDLVEKVAQLAAQNQRTSVTSVTRGECKHCHCAIVFAHHHDTVCSRFPMHCNPPRWMHVRGSVHCPGSHEQFVAEPMS